MLLPRVHHQPWQRAHRRRSRLADEQFGDVLCRCSTQGVQQRPSVGLTNCGGQCQDVPVASDTRMVALGFGKFARADRIFALERITGDERGDGRRTRVWIDGVTDPLIASRTEITILRDMGQEAAVAAPELDEAMDLAARLAAAAEEGRVDLSDLGRRARRLLATTTSSS